MWRYLLVSLLVAIAAAVALAERVPTNPQQTCAATGRCGNISSPSTISIAAPPVTSDIPAVNNGCTFPASFPCAMN